MSLAHAILGFLHTYPMTGYDLKTQQFDQSVNYFWAADQAQIYRTLDKLAEQGFVQNEIQYQENRPNRKVYHITEQGREEMRRWLTTAIPPAQLRVPHLVQLFFSAGLSKHSVIALLQQQLEFHRQMQAEYKAIPLPPFEDALATRQEMFSRFTLDFGLRYETMYIEWLKACIERLSELDEKV